MDFFSNPEIINGEIKLINITGNHDIGYGNEVSEYFLRRFEKSFGPVNSKYYLADHIFGIINSMNIDSSRDKVKQSFIINSSNTNQISSL